MRLIAIMRIKNAIETVDECLSRLSDLCDEIIILDNGSTDGTELRYASYPKIKTILHTEGYHEGRDSNILIEEAKKKGPDWIIKLDSDEILERNLTRRTLDRYMRSDYDRIDFRSYNFWLSRKLFRIDRSWFLYTLRPERCMFRNVPGVHYTNVQLHCSYFPEGVMGKSLVSPYRIKHYSHINLAQAEGKLKLYRNLDKTRTYKDDDPTIEHVIRLPFIELGNPGLNAVFIYAQHYIANLFWALLIAKRRYLKGIKIFRA